MKIRRQRKIKELISKEIIRTQEELADRLRRDGFDVTQATVSRDIKDMRLVKISGLDEEYRYALPGETYNVKSQERLKRLIQETVVSIDDSENLVVIRTIPGNAHALASLLDNSSWEEVIGTVAGDDTILMVIKPKAIAVDIRRRLLDLMD